MGIEPTIDITAEQRKTVLSLLEKHLPNTTVWVYGSRAKWTSRPQSDLDMVVFATPEQSRQVFALREAFEESNLPFRVDLFVWDNVPERFRKHIKQDYVVFSDSTDDDPAGKNWLYHPQFPRHWKRKSLYAMAQWVNGLAFREIQFSKTGKPVIKIAEIKKGISGQTKFTQQTFDESVRIQFGDLLFSWSGQPETSIDAFWWRGPEGWLNQHVFRVTPINGVDSTFFFYLLRYLKPNFVAIARNKQTTGLGHVTKRDLENIEAALPDLSEQSAIAHILGTLDDKIELNRRMNETLEEMARALFKSWFVDFDPVRAKMEGRDTGLPPDVDALFPNRLVDSELGEIPEGWEVKALEECIDVARGLSYKGTGLSSDGMPMHNLNSIYEGGGYKDGGIKYYNGDYHLRHVIQPGDVIVANTEQGHDRLLIGFAAVVPKSFGDNGLFSHHIYRVQPKDSFALTPDFICQLLNTKAMHSTVSGYATGTTVNMLPVDALRIPSIVVPPLQVVTTFSTLAKVARIRQEKLISESRTLTDLRDTLLPKLISGEMRVNTRDEESEAVIGKYQ